MALGAIYLRLSRNEEQLDVDEILAKHRHTLMKLSEQHHLKCDIFQDISSGVNVERPQLNLLLSQLEEYDYLLVMDIDRISRDNAYAEQIKQLLVMHDIKILTPQGTIDLSKESNEMMYSFQAMMANFEYKQIRKRLGRGRIAAAEQGCWTMSNRTPLGYRKDENKRLVIVEEEAKIIRYIFQKTIEQVSANEIAKQLHMLGCVSRARKVLTSSHSSNIRRDVVYRGVVHARRRINGRIVEEVFVPDAHEAIISQDKWEEVQRLLDENTNQGFFNKKKVTRRLQNLLYCLCCGRKRYLQSDGKNQDYVKSCNYKIDNNKCQDRGCKYTPIEQFVLKKVKEKQFCIETALKKIQTADFANQEKSLKLEKISFEKQLEKFRIRHQNLYTMRMDEDISKEEFLKMRNQNEEEMQRVQQQIDCLNIQLENLRHASEEQNRLEYFTEAIKRLDELEPEACNTFLKTFIKKIWFSSNATVNYDTAKPRDSAIIKIEWKE